MYAGYSSKGKMKNKKGKTESNMTYSGGGNTMPMGNASYGGTGLSSGKITKRSYMNDYK